MKLSEHIKALIDNAEERTKAHFYKGMKALRENRTTVFKKLIKLKDVE